MQVTVSDKGQGVIPASIRKKLNIKEGEKFVVSVDGNKVVLEPVGEMVKRGRGLLKDKGKEVLDYLLRERRREVEREKLCIR